ncbi:hypothetical protein GYH30_005503, partial [Glycine max]
SGSHSLSTLVCAILSDKKPEEVSTLQAFIMMKQERLEFKTKSKLFWKFKDEHKAMCNKFVQEENENVARIKIVTQPALGKINVMKLIKKFNIQSDEFISKKASRP